MFIPNPILVVISAIMDVDIGAVVRLAGRGPVLYAEHQNAMPCTRQFLAQHYFCTKAQTHPDLEMIAKSVTFPSKGKYVGSYLELKSRPGYPPVAIIPQGPFQFEIVWPEGPLAGRGEPTRQSVNLLNMRGEHYDKNTVFGQLYLAGIQGGGFNFFHVADPVSLIGANPFSYPRQ
jgi:hypothetical protein